MKQYINDVYVKACIDAYENEKALENFAGMVRPHKKIKILAFYIILVIFNNYQCPKWIGNEFTIVNGKRQRQLNSFDSETNLSPIYCGDVFRSFREVINLYTNLSNFSRIKRLIIVLEATISYLQLSFSNKNISLAYWLDLCFWINWLSYIHPQKIKSYGHFDRLTTEMSILSNKFKYQFIIQQHGIVSNLPIVRKKILCHQAFVFNKVEQKKFIDTIILNSNCVYKYNYINTLNFQKYPSNGQFIIGIAEQPVSDMMEIITQIVKNFPLCTIVIMLHPRSSCNRYSSFLNKDNIKVYKDRKISNINVLVTINSTLFLDYINAGYLGKIIITDSKSSFIAYKNTYQNIECVSNISCMLNIISHELKTFK